MLGMRTDLIANLFGMVTGNAARVGDETII